MFWILYNLLFTVGFLVTLPHYLLRMRKRGGYAHNFWQRIGAYDDDTKAKFGEGGRIWIHAVSVGELYIALKLMALVRDKRPASRFVLSVTTSTAHTIAKKEICSDDLLIYFPVDIPLVTRRVLKRMRPLALVLMEGEVWPNLIRLCDQQKIPVAIVNARISDRSFRGYQWVRPFSSRVFGMVDLFCAQSEEGRKRLLALGAAPESIHVMGSSKYDVASATSDGSPARTLLTQAGFAKEDLVLLGGSTWPGEELALCRIYRELLRKEKAVSLVLVPRHVERAGDIVEELTSEGFDLLLRSNLSGVAPPKNNKQVLLVDTTGELMDFYACADLIFIGKSLTEHGGQNVIEPAVFGKPVMVGPNMENFPVVMKDFLAADAILQVQDHLGLHTAIETLVDDTGQRERLGVKARQVSSEKRGALNASAERLIPLLGDS